MEEKLRIRIDLSYAGTNFRGWARQPGLLTVQGEIETALETVFRVPVPLTVAGRTDAGVHARFQTAHADVEAKKYFACASKQGISPELSLCRRLNKILSGNAKRRGVNTPDILLRKITLVDERFDARFSALGRSYIYRLADTLETKDPLTSACVTWIDTAFPLDLERMNSAAKALLGEHDFLSYCRPREGATTIRTLRRFEFSRNSDGVVVAHVSADAFCHSMVRSLVGAAILVGSGQREEKYLADLLHSPSRQICAPIAPPQGLSLNEVEYPSTLDECAERTLQARHRRDECGCE
ncbi:tRNA pseudouridine(38-40) synthase TruA [Actinomycetaceae bacterium TAE3-ERU4]|nr:tRNA pseudouridine(38-40) synthase TruA [Actinomycetaceae bacterium TAE3-ERU4]